MHSLLVGPTPRATRKIRIKNIPALRMVSRVSSCWKKRTGHRVKTSIERMTCIFKLSRNRRHLRDALVP